MSKAKVLKGPSAWFVEPATDRLDLGDGYWVEVKRELTVREAADVQASLIKSVRADGRVEPDFGEVWKANIVAYLVDWNLDRHGKPVPFTPAAVDNLSKAAWGRIEQAVQAHLDAQEAARAGKSIGSTSTSASPSAE